MAIEQRVEGSAERGHEQEQRRPWETPVLREIVVGVGTATKIPIGHETTDSFVAIGPS